MLSAVCRSAHIADAQAVRRRLELRIFLPVCTRAHSAFRGEGDNYRNDRFLFAKEVVMNITLSLAPLVSLLAGILILIVPRMLNYIVAAYLIVFGILGLFGDIRLK
jgi:Protein of unknown function (DUF3096)